MKLIYPACFYPCDETKGAFAVVVPDLPGCVTQGKDLAEAISMAEDAASGWVLDELEEGRQAPAASLMTNVRADEYGNGFVSLIVLDMDAYAEKYGKKAVRKNVTIPAWLNSSAEARHINFSQVLQEALMEKVKEG